MTTTERIQAMDDFQVVRFFEYFSRELVEGATVSLEQIKQGIPDATRAIDGFAQIENLSPEEAERSLSPAQSAAMARTILLQLAEDPQFRPVLDGLLDGYRDDELVVDVILAVGLVASVLLIIATTEFSVEVKLGKRGTFKFVKGRASPQLVRAVTVPFVGVVSNSAADTQTPGPTPG